MEAASPDEDLTALSDEIDLDADAIVREEAVARRRTQAIEAGRRSGGLAGAAMAGAMIAIGEIYVGPPRDDGVAVAESPDDPGDIDLDGITVHVAGLDVWAPPPGDPRAAPPG
ncbi:hypothetical protein [Ilumatobacter sp.]|uniref:hypothetical protein n=1 Tax=Ilumatobacter sp. TaxID=1967498 RepID=UPI003B52D0F6